MTGIMIYIKNCSECPYHRCGKFDYCSAMRHELNDGRIPSIDKIPDWCHYIISDGVILGILEAKNMVISLYQTEKEREEAWNLYTDDAKKTRGWAKVLVGTKMED